MGIALAAASAPAAFAAPAERYDDGAAAYQRNEFDKSLKALRPLSDKGDVRAQYLLGRHYQFGQGVKTDRAEAYFWYRRAEAKGHLEAKLFRQLLEIRGKLSASEKAQGERRLAELNAPKTKPEKPKIETAVAREPERPRITAKPSEPPKAEAARPETEKPPAKPVVVAARITPPAKSSAIEESRAAAADRAETPRPPSRRQAQNDDDDDAADSPAYRPNPPPAETRAAIVPPSSDYRSDDTHPPAYAPTAYPSYPPPSWRPQAYHYPQPHYAPGWGYQPNRGYMHPGWRAPHNPAWRGHVAWGPNRGMGYRRGRGY